MPLYCCHLILLEAATPPGLSPGLSTGSCPSRSTTTEATASSSWTQTLPVFRCSLSLHPSSPHPRQSPIDGTIELEHGHVVGQGVVEVGLGVELDTRHAHPHLGEILLNINTKYNIALLTSASHLVVSAVGVPVPQPHHQAARLPCVVPHLVRRSHLKSNIF